MFAARSADLVPKKWKSGTKSSDGVTWIHFFLDGAHTKESINLCIDWFNKSSATFAASPPSTPSSVHLSASSSVTIVNRVLLFNCTGYRNPIELLTPVLQATPFSAVLFSPNKLMRDKKASSDQSNFMVDPESEEKKAVDLKNTWLKLTASESSYDEPTSLQKSTGGQNDQLVKSFSCLTEAISWIGETAESGVQTHVLVTGSLHLVGGVLAIVDPDGRSFDSSDSRL